MVNGRHSLMQNTDMRQVESLRSLTTRDRQARWEVRSETAPATKRDLWHATRKYLGYHIAYRPVCPEHCAPFDFLADAYFGRFDSAVVEGARGSGKTRLLSILHQLNSRYKDGLETAHIGGTLAQAMRCYEYLREYAALPLLGASLEGEPLMRETRWKNGSRLYILPGTEAAVSGPHPHRVVGDEVDHWKWRVYQLALGMPASDDRYPAQQIWTSARRTSYGTMTRIIKEGRERGLPFYSWCVWDSLRACPDCEDASLAERGIVSQPPKCPLWKAGCEGKVRKATGHMHKQDVINSYLASDDESFSVQFLLKTASRSGLVYANWSEENVTLEAEYVPDRPVLWAMDYGHENPNVCLLLQEMPNGDVHQFDEVYVKHRLVGQFLNLLHASVSVESRAEERWFVEDPETGEVRGPYGKPDAAYIDPSASELKGQVGLLNVPVMGGSPLSRVEGCAVVRRLICDANGHRSWLVHPRCHNTIAEVETYHKREIMPGVYGEEPEKDTHGDNPDHAQDSFRYYAAKRHAAESRRIAVF